MAIVDISVILPCYNEADNISHIISKFMAVIPPQLNAEIILVNNGSTDDSQNVLENELKKLRPAHPFRVVEIKKNKGYGFGILSGLAKAKGKVLAWTHADLQTNPKDVFEAYKIFSSSHEKFILVKGKRKNRPFAEDFFTSGMQWLVWVILRRNINDINAQPKLFSREFYEKFLKDQSPHDFSLDLFILYQADKFGTILDFPVFFNKRLHGEAKGGGSFKTRLKLIQRTLTYILKLRRSLK
ncbi:MAG: glycosyltransferase family 2 protein [bacterium]|nr:glycosyltransferase family 2 protein [bacterium]